MQLTPTIRKILSALLICIFALSITPVQLVHSLFAKHADKSNNVSLTHTQLSESGYNCNCDNQVAEGQFLKGCTPTEFMIIKIYPEHIVYPVYTFFSQHHFFSELRGPPVIA